MWEFLSFPCEPLFVRLEITSKRFIADQSDSNHVVYAMNKTIGSQLVIYGLLLAGLSFLTHYLSQGMARPTLIVGVIGGMLCVVWGLRSVAGSRGKALPLLTLIPVNFVLLSQVFLGWSSESQGVQAGRIGLVLITLLLGLSVGMMVRIAWAGEFGNEQPSTPTKGEAIKP
jgi:hypothetical protein